MQGLSYGNALAAANANANSTLLEFVHSFFLENIAVHDAGIAVWGAKRYYDAVRPFSAVRKIYGAEPVTAWGGPGVGTVTDIPGNDWESYLAVADHPEYPSASACFCASLAQVRFACVTRACQASFEASWSPLPATLLAADASRHHNQLLYFLQR